MFEVISTIVKYIFITIIYFFMFSIIRLIYLDIKQSRLGSVFDDGVYIKLMNKRHTVPFSVEETYNIKDGSVIGRGARADIMIPDPFLSTAHAVFKKEEDMFTIADNNSTNGTFVNGEKITAEPCALKTGDLIKAGQLIFIFVEPAEE